MPRKFRAGARPFPLLSSSGPHKYADYDNDGLVNLLMLSAERLQVFRHIGGGRWPETGDAARLPGAAPGPGSSFQAMALGDLRP